MGPELALLGSIAFMRDGAIVLADLDAGRLRTVQELEYSRPLVVSHDGRSLVFWKHSEIGWDLWRLDLVDDAGEPVNLTDVKSGGCRSARFSPDDRRIAYMRDLPEGLYVMNADGTDRRRLTTHGHRDAAPAWSPDGTRLVFMSFVSLGPERRRADLWIVDADGANERRLTAPEAGASDEPGWSHDGDWVVFAGTRDGNDELCAITPDGAVERNLTRSPERERRPVVGPGGRRVAYVAVDEARRHVRVMGVDGREPHTLTTQETPIDALVWSPDGRHLAYTTGGTLYRLALDGDAAVKVAEGDVYSPVWVRPPTPAPPTGRAPTPR